MKQKTHSKYKPETILIGFRQYSSIEFKEDGFRLLFDTNYVIKLKQYLNFWGVDEIATCDGVITDCYNLVKTGEYNKRNDLPMTFSASTRYGTTMNLLNDIKVQFIENTLFGDQYNSDIFVIDVEKEQLVHFWI